VSSYEHSRLSSLPTEYIGRTRPTACNPSKADWVAEMSFKILIVDDSAIMRRLLRISIEEHLGWRQLVEAENGEIAIQKAKEIKPDVVVLDWNMPGLNGIETARKISQIDPKPAMALFTLHEEELVASEAHAAGIQRIFSKTKSLNPLLEWLKAIGSLHPVVGL
jgi:DNA-binding NarL/FixJ family response regulator